MAKIDEIRTRLASKRFSTRKRGMEELLQSGARDEFIAFALAEKDKDLVAWAVEWMHPTPPAALLLHYFHLNRQPVPMSGIAASLSVNNYLYAEEEIFAQYEGQGNKLALETVVAVGHGYLRSFAPLLRKIVAQDLEVASVAYQRTGKRAVAGGRHAFRKPMPGEAVVYTNLENEWSSPSQKVIEAAVALRRLDCAISPSDLQRLRAQEREADWPDGGGGTFPGALDWVAFDSLGDEEIRRSLLEHPLPTTFSAYLADFATTLLKRGMTEELDGLLQSGDPNAFYCYHFCHWPLLDYLVHGGHLKLDQQIMADRYLANRRLGVACPPWWQWLSK